jgi:hypothetical protein
MEVQLLVFDQETASSKTIKSGFLDLIGKVFGGCRRRHDKKRITDSDEESNNIKIVKVN